MDLCIRFPVFSLNLLALGASMLSLLLFRDRLRQEVMSHQANTETAILNKQRASRAFNSGFRDWVPKELQRVGCVELLNTVQRRVRPKLHVFGGIHEGYGTMTDGYTTYVNASTCTVSFQPINPPIIFDLPNPQVS